MLRALVLALLLANVAFYAWTQGWLDAVVGVRASGDREPERLARQLRPETVRVLPPDAAGASAPGTAGGPDGSAGPDALACLEAGPFSAAELAAAQAAAQAALPAGRWATVPADRPGAWIVYMGPYPTRDALTKKEDELKRRALPYDELRDNPTLAPGLALGRYDQRASADAALQRLVQQGVRSARVVELAAASSGQWLRVDHADAALAARLVALKDAAFGKGFAACAASSPAGR